jgi:hypothetical protein
MEQVTLGSTGIRLSRLGIGTGTAHPAGGCAQARMGEEELAGVLLHAFDQGVTFWDTAMQYGTYRHIGAALRQVPRGEVTLVTKFITTGHAETMREFHRSLRETGTEYFDVCLLHALRTREEFALTRGALDALLELKAQGKVRAVGFSCHGVGALGHGLDVPEMEAVWTRVNHAGLHMDPSRMGWYDRALAMPWLKKTANRLVPNPLRAVLRPDPHNERVSDDERRAVEELQGRYHAAGRGVVGMKVLGEGLLGGDPGRAIGYVKGLPFVDAMVIGMMTKDEVSQNVRLVEG